MEEKKEPRRTRWLTRSVVGIGVASFFSDLGHETATSVLPMFLAGLGAMPAALGIIEGVSDAISSFSKLGAGWYSDRLHHRKPMAVAGYFLTGISSATFGIAGSWFHLLIGRTVGWFGRGIRGPVRDAILTDAVPSDARGRAFGFDRALDTLGAILGPIAALWLLGVFPIRTIFFFTVIPGILAALSFLLLVRETPRVISQGRSFSFHVKNFPLEYRRFLVAVAVFGAGDFSHTMLILRASQILSSTGEMNVAQSAVTLYVVHNIIYAAASYPIGALGDRIGKRKLLAVGYLLSAIMCAGFLLPNNGYLWLAILFSLGGLYIGIEDSLERAVAADLLPAQSRGTGFGMLAAVNGLGDLISSIVVGILWSAVSASAGFIYAGVLSLLGAFLVLRLRYPNDVATTS